MFLQTDVTRGICGNHGDIARRQEVFGCNRYHKLATKSFFQFVLTAIKDPIIVILLVCASLSLGFNINEVGFRRGWYDGGSILIAVLVVVTICSVSHFWPNRQFNKLSKIVKEVLIDVVRNGQHQQVSISEIVVGDVVRLRSESEVPADGLFLDGHLLKLDESSMIADNHNVEVNKHLNPFLFCGTKVASGYGQMLITSVGENTKWGKIMSLLGIESYKWRSLESRLRVLTSAMSIVGSSVAVSTVTMLTCKYFLSKMRHPDGTIRFRPGMTRISDVWREVLGILVTTVAVASSAIPEGLPLAVAITVVYITKKMINNRAILRRFSACDPLTSVSTICTDTTGILTVNQMKLRLCLDEEFIDEGSSHLIVGNARLLLCQGIGLNTSQAPSEPSSEFSRNSIEEAIFNWASTELGMDVKNLQEGFSVQHGETLIGESEVSKILIKKEEDYTIHMHLKGTAETILAKCSDHYETEGIVKAMDNSTRRKLEHIIQAMGHDGFKCIAFAHKILKNEHHDGGEFQQRLEDDSLTLIALIGVKDPIRPGVAKAIEDCKKAGVNIKVITRDDCFTATAIASECGILDLNEDLNNGEVMEALEFQNYTATERMEKVGKIRVIAKASCADKLLLVQCLKQKGHVVAVTGNSTGDAPALKEADVGIHIGFQGNDIAIKNSDIVVLNDGFVSVLAVLQVGRGIYENIKVFIQFLLAANIASLVTDFVSTVFTDTPPTIDIVVGVSANEIPYAVLQILWVKLVIGTLAALALVVEQKTEEFMQEPPARPGQPLISNKICTNIIVHASYEIIILLTFQFKGEAIFSVDGNVKDTLVFNLLVLFQVFNVLKARKPEGNIFQGILRRKLFWGIICLTLILQVMMMEVLPRFAAMERLNSLQWVACIGIAFTCWPIGYIGSKFIPVAEKPYLTI